MAQQSSAVSIPTRAPLVPAPGQRGYSLAKDSLLTNAFAEMDPVAGQYQVFKRPGFSADRWFVPPAGNVGLGMFQWEQDPAGLTEGLVSIYGNISSADVYRNETILGPTAGSARYYRFVPLQGTPPLLVFGDGPHTYYTDGATVFVISGAGFDDYPDKVPGIAYLNRRLYLMSTTGVIIGSTNPDDPLGWSALNFISAGSEADYAVCLAQQGPYIIALKSSSIEVFYDAGSPIGSPLLPMIGAQKPFGCLDAGTVCSIDGSLFFASSSSNEDLSPQIMRMENLAAQVISTPPVERIIAQSVPYRGLTNIMGFNSFGLKMGGHRWYVLNIPPMQVTLIYDLDQNLWYHWYNDTGGVWPYVAASYSKEAGYHLLQFRDAGNIVRTDIASQLPSDGGFPIRTDIVTPNFDGGVGRRKTLNNIGFNADKVAGSVLLVRHNDDDYDPARWSPWRTVDLNLRYPRLSKCGTFRRRAWQFRHESLTDFRMSAPDLQLDIGTL